jgi:hypothetical protein
MFLSGHIMGRIGAIVLVVIAIPTLVATLRAKAERDRDRIHPSR